ncbi:MAG: peptidoglycan DD-metalloendopeptidase family protein [Ekhidna sp.]|nr:peptidoglycan DD-metalloendopeptidase family protein [Ekhidna sp.]MBC6409322.1 peptidoglycan DD-metalloendopeptidase family protein [Ekhidna sp.]MBC6425536.1 peptidoglycan DD-metalloendopeptidase family protein [Ekhidna sp.]
MKGISIHIFIISFLLLALSTSAQKTKTQLESEKRENLKKIAEAERILSETSDQKQVTLGQLRALNQQINARELLIRSIGSEISLLDGEISDLSAVVNALQNDLRQLKEEYADQIYATYKSSRGNSRLMFLFSAKDFNQLLQRLKYLEQYADARRLQAEQIEVVTKELNEQRSRVETKRAEQQKLLSQQVRESRKLANSKKKQSQLVAQLSKKERELRRDLEYRKAANKRLNALIANTIEAEEVKDANASTAEIASTAELTRLFESKKNTLTWPVSSGFIASKFGTQKHPVLKRIKIVNDGVGIQTERDSKVRAVFDGEVTMTGVIPGKNNFVLIRHGSYLTVYARLKSINVKKGRKVKVGDIIGEVYTDQDGVTELEFQVYKGTTKLNPEHWLAMK